MYRKVFKDDVKEKCQFCSRLQRQRSAPKDHAALLPAHCTFFVFLVRRKAKTQTYPEHGISLFCLNCQKKNSSLQNAASVPFQFSQ